MKTAIRYYSRHPDEADPEGDRAFYRSLVHDGRGLGRD